MVYRDDAKNVVATLGAEVPFGTHPPPRNICRIWKVAVDGFLVEGHPLSIVKRAAVHFFVADAVLLSLE